MPRTIAVATGTRAEYGLLYWLLKEIEADPELKLRLMVTGAHLEPRFGDTWRSIEADGFRIDDRIPLQISGDTPVDIAAAMGRGIQSFAEALSRCPADILVVLGDRYEMLAAVQGALLCRVPIGHIHGGERTEGVLDEAFRHAITKMSHLHFASCETYRNRIIQMGEAPERVFDVGALGVDAIERLELADLDELQQAVGLPLSDGFVLVTFHPVTLQPDSGMAALNEMLAALDDFPSLKVVITGVNADPGHDVVARRLARYADERPDRVRLVASLGQRRYLGAMRACRAVIGNSSSGIIEAPSLKVPTVNIGDRQKGRVRAISVIDCNERHEAIRSAVMQALSPEFRQALAGVGSPYGEGGAAGRIRRVLRESPLSGLLAKAFHDLPQVDNLR